MKKQPVVALILVAILVASHESGMTMGVEAVTCDTPFYKCSGVCYKSGKCNACCKQLGYLRGKCDFLRGMECLCCHEDHTTSSSPQPLPPTAAELPS